MSTSSPPPSQGELTDQEVEAKLLAPFLYGRPDVIQGGHASNDFEAHEVRVQAWLSMMTGSQWQIGTATPPTSTRSVVYLPPVLPGPVPKSTHMEAFRVMALMQAGLQGLQLFEQRAWLQELHDDWVLELTAHILMAQAVLHRWKTALPGIWPQVQKVTAEPSLNQLWLGRQRVEQDILHPAVVHLLDGLVAGVVSHTPWVSEILGRVRTVEPTMLRLVLPGLAHEVREALRREQAGAPPRPFWIGTIHPSWLLETPKQDQARASEWKRGPAPLRQLLKKRRAKDTKKDQTSPARFDRPPTQDNTVERNRYREWDANLGVYRPSFTQIIETDAASGPVSSLDTIRQQHRTQIEQLRHDFERLRIEARWLHAQRDGSDLDYPRVIQAATDTLAGAVGSSRIYRRFESEQRPLVVLTLVDLSGSTRGSVLPEEQKAVVLFSEALQAYGAPYAFYGFNSDGPQTCRFLRIRGWNENDMESAKRLGNLSAAGGSRMGAHIRHACKRLSARPEEVRVLIVLSDGKPEDRGEYRGKYGIADTAMAVREARGAGVFVHCISLDRDEPKYLKTIFGPHGYTVVPDAAKLPSVLPKVFLSIS